MTSERMTQLLLPSGYILQHERAYRTDGTWYHRYTIRTMTGRFISITKKEYDALKPLGKEDWLE